MTNVIPMLKGKHYFLLFPCSVGTPISLFSTPLRWECLKHNFSENLPIIHILFDCLLCTGAAWRPTVFDDLQISASHPARGSSFWISFSMDDLLRCERHAVTCENVCPTLRGDHMWDFDVPSVNCCDAEVLRYHWKTQQNTLYVTRTGGCRSILRVYQVDLFLCRSLTLHKAEKKVNLAYANLGLPIHSSRVPS